LASPALVVLAAIDSGCRLILHTLWVGDIIA